MLCWGRSSTGTTGIGLFTATASPFPQAQNRQRGQLNYGMSVCVSAMTVYLTWSGCGLKLTGKSHLYHPQFSSLLGRSAVQGLLLMLFFVLNCLCCSSSKGNSNTLDCTVTVEDVVLFK